MNHDAKRAKCRSTCPVRSSTIGGPEKPAANKNRVRSTSPKYQVSVQGQVPADLAERISRLHATALLARRFGTEGDAQ
jgi:hypothetical protein